MLTLIKLHRSANPDASTDDMTQNVKRKFLKGISPQLRRNLFIFCQDPHSDTITTEKLLEAVRKTKLHLMEQTDTVSFTLGNPTVNTVHPASTPVAVDATLSAINHLTTMFTEHIQTTEAKSKEQEAQINAIHAIQADNAVRTRDTGGNLLPLEVVLPPVDVVGRVAVLQVASQAQLRVLQQEPMRASSVGIVAKRTILHVTVKLLL